MDKAMIGETEMDNNRQKKSASKLQFTNDCDPDMTICELQHENEKLLKQIEDAEDVISEIYEDSNPVYLVGKKVQYFKEYTDE